MQFDVIIGNPPYQLDDGGGAAPALPRSTSCSSSRQRTLEPTLPVHGHSVAWFAGGKGLDEFRESMLADDRLRSIDDYRSCFGRLPGRRINGGVCYFLWDRDNPGPCEVTTHIKDEPLGRQSPDSSTTYDVFVRFNEAVDPQEGRGCRDEASLELVSPETSRSWSAHEAVRTRHTFKHGKAAKGSDDLYWSTERRHGLHRTREARSANASPDRQVEGLHRPSASTGPEQRHLPAQDPQHAVRRASPAPSAPRPILCIGPFDSESQAESVASYLSHSVHSLPRLAAQDHPRHNARASTPSCPDCRTGRGSGPTTDLYAKYGLTDERDRVHRVRLIRPMDLDGQRGR